MREPMLTCAWKSRRCDPLKPAVPHLVTVRGKTEEKPLCEFHGQAWPRVGESAEDAERRTKHARVALSGKPDYARKREEHRRKKNAFSGPIVRD